jgi:uncharacterized protein
MQTFLLSITTAFRRGFALLLGTVLMMQLLIMPALAIGVYELPQTAPEGHILDLAEILSRITEGQINSQLDELSQSSQQEVTIVTVRRLDYDETIDTFAQKTFERWYPTPEAQANKTLLAIDTLTDNTGIVQGEKSKATMSAEIATSVAKETVLVPLKYGNRYNQAFLDASDRMSKVLSGQEDPGAPEFKENVVTEGNFATAEETKESNATVWVVVLLVLSTAIPMATYYFYQYMGNR